MIKQLQLAFRRYDKQSAPHGLYAIREARGLEQPDPENWGEWRLIIKPILDQQFYRANLAEGEFRIGSALTIHLLRLSKIKVRRYGNRYRLDPHLDFSARWEVNRMQAHVRTLSKMGRGERLLILLGFAREQHPFEDELEQLKQTAGASAFERAEESLTVWSDPHLRGFHTLLAIWQWRG